MVKKHRMPVDTPMADLDSAAREPLHSHPKASLIVAAELADDNDDPMADPDSLSQAYEDDSEPSSDPSDSIAASFQDDEEELEIDTFEGAPTLNGHAHEHDGGLPIPDHDIPLMSQQETLQPSPIATTAPSTISDLLTPSASNALIHVQKPTPYIHDAGHLLITDPNPLLLPTSTNPTALEAALTCTTRDAAQSLLNHLLTHCPIRKIPSTTTSGSGVEMELPPPLFHLPREKVVPTPKPPTKWETFAKKKGITKGGRDGEGRAGKMVYDAAKGEWVPKWGYKGKNKDGEGDWLVEVDEKAEQRRLEEGTARVGGGVAKRGGQKTGVVVAGAGRDPRGLKRSERKERVKRNERAQRANDRKARSGKVRS